MKKLFVRLANALELHEAPRRTVPLVEIMDNCSVLIENHYGVTQYSQQKIKVQTRTGHVEICGDHLRLIQMSKEQLCVQGRIDSVNLFGGGKNEGL